MLGVTKINLFFCPTKQAIGLILSEAKNLIRFFQKK